MDRPSDRRGLDAPVAARDDAHEMPAGLAIEAERSLAVYRPVGSHRLHEIADRVGEAIEACRRAGLAALLADLRGMGSLPAATPVDRFLAVEEWAGHARGQVAVAFVIAEPIVPPPSFVRRAAADFGLRSEMFADEREARAWLAGLRGA